MHYERYLPGSFFLYSTTSKDMPLSNAERQRRYRQKQKDQNAAAYMERERDRKKSHTYPPKN